jgi:quinoprotein glucose dehydrogenase
VLFEATLDARLVALDAATGSPCADFGSKGQLNLRHVPEYQAGWYHMTSPPAVIDGLVIVGSSINDNARTKLASGVVRAFDARTGALKWSWDPLPPDVAAKSGAANAWSVMAVDPERHLVFVPTGNASPTTTADSVPATTSGRTPSSRCVRKPASSHGAFSS